MNSSIRQVLVRSSVAISLVGAALAQSPVVAPAVSQTMPGGTNYTTVSSTISQLNYDRDANVEGFLLSNHVLVHLPPQAAPWLAASLHAGDSIQVKGLERTLPSGLRRLEAQSVQDHTSGKSVTIPTAGAPAPYSGTGRVAQLNYAADGSVNGFILDNGTLAEVPPFSEANPSSIRVGSSLTFSGRARNSMSGHTVVEVQTLSVGGQQIAFNTAPPPRGPAAPPAPPRRGGRAAQPPAAPPAPAAAPANAGPASAGPAGAAPGERVQEPPPPPAPPQ